MAVSREVKEGTLQQGVDEAIYWKLTTTPWGSTPTAVAVTAFARSASATWTTVTSTVLSGAASVEGDVITLPKLSALTEGTFYRIEVKFTAGGNIFEAIIPVQAER